MVETSVAIIATCLPALRTLILGHISRIGTESAGRHYELSSRRPGNGTQRQTFTGGRARVTGLEHDSDDELVKEGASVSSAGMPTTETRMNSPHGITVETEFEISEEVSAEAKGQKTHFEV